MLAVFASVLKFDRDPDGKLIVYGLPEGPVVINTHETIVQNRGQSVDFASEAVISIQDAQMLLAKANQQFDTNIPAEILGRPKVVVLHLDDYSNLNEDLQRNVLTGLLAELARQKSKTIVRLVGDEPLQDLAFDIIRQSHLPRQDFFKRS